MSNALKVVLAVGVILVAGWLAIHVLEIVTGLLLHLVLPVAILAGAGYLLYRVLAPKALGGSRRFLP
jgi:hypothetical protein